METLESIKARTEGAVPGVRLEIIPNDSPARQPSLLVDSEHALAVARFWREDASLRLDYASNVTGVDWLDSVLKEKVKVKKIVEGTEKEVDEVVEKKKPGYLEVVYHLYSMALKQGPVVLRQRTENRADKTHVADHTPEANETPEANDTPTAEGTERNEHADERGGHTPVPLPTEANAHATERAGNAPD